MSNVKCGMSNVKCEMWNVLCEAFNFLLPVSIRQVSPPFGGFGRGHFFSPPFGGVGGGRWGLLYISTLSLPSSKSAMVPTMASDTAGDT